jgi:hypothetical protein
MKKVLLIVMLAAPPAFAQGGYNPAGAIFPAALTIGVLETGFVVSSLATAVGSSTYRTPGWFASSYVNATGNSLMTAACIFGIWQTARGNLGKPDPLMVAGALGHGALTLWNLLAPTLALSMRKDEPSITPTAMGGRDRSGRRWAGIGIQLSGL